MDLSNDSCFSTILDRRSKIMEIRKMFNNRDFLMAKIESIQNCFCILHSSCVNHKTYFK